MNRRVLVVGALAAVLVLAGCSNPIPEEQLQKNATYEWDTNATVAMTLSANNYQAIYHLQNRSTLEVYSRDGLGQERPVPIESLQFQYPNGTVVNASAYERDSTSSRVILTPPNATGKVAFTAPLRGKTLSTPVFVEGSHEVTLPNGTRVGIPILSNVSPGGYETSIRDDGRMTLRWENVTARSMTVDYYVQRDVFMFGGLLGLVSLVALVGLVYYLRQIRSLEQRREDVGLDVDTEDDDIDDGGPPPGMR